MSLLMITVMLRDNIGTVTKLLLTYIRALRQEAMVYISDVQEKKTNIPRSVISSTVTHDVESMKQFFSNLRSGGLTIQD